MGRDVFPGPPHPPADGASARAARRRISRCAAPLLLLASQGAALAPGVDDVRFSTRGSAAGLPQVSVAEIVQDRSGMLWVATQDGLARYDGSRFTTFRRSEHPASLADNFLLAMVLDAEERLWIASQATELTLLDLPSLHFRRLPLEHDGTRVTADDLVQGMVALADGGLLVAMRRSPPIRFDRNGHPARAAGLDRPVRVVGESHAGPLLQIGNELWQLDQALAPARRLHTLAAGVYVNHALLEANRWWLATVAHGLYEIDPASGEVRQHLADDSDGSLSDAFVRKLLRDANGALWAATSSGLDRYADGHFRSWRASGGDPFGVPGSRISTLLEDRDGLLWVGTWTGGMAFHDPRSQWVTAIRHLPRAPASLPSTQVIGIDVAPDGRLHVAFLDGTGLAAFDPERGLRHVVGAEAGLGRGELSTLEPSRSGDLWVGSLRGGLHRVSRDGRLLESFRQADLQGLAGDRVLSIHEGADGELWVGLLGEGLSWRCAGCSGFRNFRSDPDDPASLPSDTVSVIHAFPEGTIWFGHRRGGLSRFDRERERFVRYRFDPGDPHGLPHPSVTALAHAAGRLVIGTHGGIAVLQPQAERVRFVKLGRADGLPNESVSCLVAEDERVVWAALAGAVARIDAEKLSVTTYTHRDGLFDRDYFVNACRRGPDGRLYFGGLAGITVLDPKRRPAPVKVPAPVLTELTLARGPVSPGHPLLPGALDRQQALALPHDVGYVGLGFVAPEFRDPASVRYRHRLVGISEDWIEGDQDRRHAAFANLRHGEYRFEVETWLAGEARLGARRTLVISIATPPWLSPWAFAGYGLAALALLTAISLPLLLRARERERARARLAASEARLRMVLNDSGCELWRLDFAARRIWRDSRLVSLDLPETTEAGHPIEDFFSVTHPEDRARVDRAMGAYLKGQCDAFEETFRFRCRDGSYLWVRSRGQALTRDRRGHVLLMAGTTVDIHQLKQSEQALRDLADDLKAKVMALEHLSNELAAAQAQRELALWGSGCEFFVARLKEGELHRENRIAGLKVNAAGNDLSAYWPAIHPEDRERCAQAFVQHVKGLSAFYDVVYRVEREDGSWCWVKTRGRAVERDADGFARTISGTSFDISELKEKELALTRLTEELEHRVEERTADLSKALEALKEAQSELVESEKLAALGGLVAGVAHEINTPLGVAITAASHLRALAHKLAADIETGVLKRSQLLDHCAQAVESAELVQMNLNRAATLVRSFKQVAVDQSSEERRRFDLAGYLQDTLNSLQPTFKRQPHRITLHCSPGIEMDSYPGALYQCVVNVLVNAMTHAFDPDQAGSIEVAARRIPEGVVIAIADDGHGMSEDTRRRAFEPFFTTRRGQGGSGLGLHLVFNLVTRVLGGEVRLDSSPGQGTVVSLRLPLVAPQADQARTGSPE